MKLLPQSCEEPRRAAGRSLLCHLPWIATFAWLTFALTARGASPAKIVLPARPEYLAEVWDTDRGLPSFGVTAVTQAPDGYLWVATFEGLARFDGVRFTVINHTTTPEFPGRAVNSVFFDRQSRLWTGSDKGIACLKDGHWSVYAAADGQPIVMANSFIEGRDGSIMAAAGERLLSLVQDRFVTQPIPTPAAFVRGFRDTAGDLWVATDRYLARFEQGQWHTVSLPPEMAGSELQGAAASRDGGVWLAATSNLYKLQNGAWTKPVQVPDGFRFTRTVKYLEDSGGNLWVGDHSRGIFQFCKDGRVLRFTRADGLPNLAIRSLFEDREKNIWVGTDGGGLARFRSRAIRMFDESHGLEHIVLDSVAETANGGILVGTYGSGLFRFDAGRERFGVPVEHPEFGRPNVESLVLSALEDRVGTIWAGVDSRGLFRIRGTAVERTPLEAVGGEAPKSMFEDSRGAMWFGTRKGVARYQDGQFQIYGQESGMPAADIYSIAEDRDGEVWAGGDGGLFHLQEGVFRRYVPTGMNTYERILSLARSGDGSLWIGAEGRGLDRLRDGVLTNFGEAQGLPAVSIGSILEDGEGRLWLASFREGLVCIPIASFDAVAAKRQAKLDVIWLKQEDGLSTNQFRIGHQPAAWKSRNGMLWFATLKGLAMVDPSRIWRNPVVPPVRIESIGMSGGSILVDPAATGRLTLPAGSRRLEFFFTALSFVAPERVQFQYRLESLDPIWLDTTDRSVSFGDLRPGDYTLRVRAANNDGVWNPEPAVLEFHVAPFVWQTWWFQVAALASLAVLTGIAVYGSQRKKLQARTRQLRLEQTLRRDVERLQAVLKVSEERFSKAFNASPLPMSIATLQEGRFVDVNRCFLDRTGLQREEVIGQTRAELGLWDDRRHNAEFQAEVECHGRVRGLELVMRDRKGVAHHLLVSAEVIELDGVRCLLSVSDDITDRKLLEEQLRQSQKLESVGRLAGGIAHDFNNLLTVINGYSSMILQHPEKTDLLPRRMAQIRQAGERAAELTQQLLAFSRKQVIQPKPLNLNTLVYEMEAMLRRLLPENIEIVLRLDPALGEVLADHGQIYQVLMNLAANARDAMPHGGNLIVETANLDLSAQYAATHTEVKPGPSVLLGVTDTGVGMEEEVLKHIFEPFFTTKGIGAGTGLGLATVYGIVRQSGGWISAYSEPAKGTSFKIYLPRIGGPAAPAPERTGPGMLAGTETVLLVEDQPDVRNLAREVLESFGYRVLEAVNGAAALEVAAQYQGKIHLLLTDVVMPVMNGTDLARRLTTLRPETKVLYTSGYTENVIVHQGILKPGIAFVPKPLSPDVLVEKVRETLGSPD